MRRPAEAPADLARALALLEQARADGRAQLLEHEAAPLLAALGIAAPRALVLPDVGAVDALALDELPGERAVLKLLARDVAHKTELGGVAVVARERAALRAAAGPMLARARGAGVAVEGLLVCEHVAHEREPGGELLLGLRWSRELGPLVTLGLGGVTAEPLARALRPDEGPLVLAPALATRARLEAALASRALGALATGALRGRAPRVPPEELAALLERLLAFAAAALPAPLAELEVNPLVYAGGRFVALDALVRTGAAPAPDEPPRPLERAAGMLRPRSMAVLGVSARAVNPARLILRNTLAAGFPPDALRVVKPGVEELDGVACVPDLASLPAPVDLLVVALPARDVPAALEEAIAGRRAEGIVLVTGGLGELEGSAPVVDALRARLRRARADAGWSGPVVNGGNCLGLRSAPGRVDTLFIPHAKLPLPTEPPQPVALLSQSGAFAIARLSRLPWLAPRELITFGNQLDLTAADWLDVLAQDPALRVIACYVEGFRALDGLRFARRVRALAEEGRLVIVYRAGRTAAGAAASASHTASLAGDPVAGRALLRDAGALVADTIEELEDLLCLATRLATRPVPGTRLGVLSNAGFECVAAADSLGALRLAELSPGTRAALHDVLARGHLGGFVDVQHPLDLTPIADDATFAAAARALLSDPGVDVGLVGCVPLTGRLHTLAGEAQAGDAVGPLLADLWRDLPRAWCAVVDAGRLHAPLVAALEAAGVPVLRRADRATHALGRYAAWRAAHPGPG